jgi:hypothetical protein
MMPKPQARQPPAGRSRSWASDHDNDFPIGQTGRQVGFSSVKQRGGLGRSNATTPRPRSPAETLKHPLPEGGPSIRSPDRQVTDRPTQKGHIVGHEQQPKRQHPNAEAGQDREHSTKNKEQPDRMRIKREVGWRSLAPSLPGVPAPPLAPDA